ncbi:MAG: beta-ketoacyl-ACP synthase II [Eubacteriales bacterium]|nr:beta-ketoacyl-ACP synthase II [Eubacteriales bacterium]
MRRVVITGMGAVTPVGNNVNDMWEAVKAGKCGIGRITHYDTDKSAVKLAGEVKDFDSESIADKAELRKMDDFTIYALAAADEAVKDSGIDFDEENTLRCGVILSSGIGGLTTIQRECLRGESKGYDRVSPHFVPMSITNMAAGHVAIRFGLHGMCTSVVTACASGTNAVGDALRQIRDGYQDVVVCGGAESCITDFGIGGFTSMHALSKSEDVSRASIPFDKERSGFVMGEGAGVLILEEYEHALNRGAKIYCEVAGYGSTCDANHVTAPLEDGSMAAQAMMEAVKDAGVSADRIDYINAHGTSTKLNDKGETNAIKKAFGEHAYKLAISSTKSMTGHMLGASGAVEAIISALAVKNDIIPPTINYRVPDDDCDLDIVPNVARSTSVDYAMSNSLGFGGHNASIVLRKVV